MMNWEVSKKLLMFEFRNTPIKIYLYNIILGVIYGWVFAILFPIIMIEVNQPSVIVDIVFLLGIAANIYLFREQPFFLRELKSNFFAAPFQVLLRKMPISYQTIIASRFMATIIWNTAVSIVFLVTLYISLSGEQQQILFPHYGSFSVVWILLVIGFSGGIAAAEPGAYMTKRYINIWLLVVIVLFLSGATTIRLITGKYTVEWFLAGLAHSPILFPIAIMPVTAVMVWYFVRYMKRYMMKTNYHV